MGNVSVRIAVLQLHFCRIRRQAGKYERFLKWSVSAQMRHFFLVVDNWRKQYSHARPTALRARVQNLQILYSKTCVKWPLKKRQNKDLNESRKYCRMLQGLGHLVPPDTSAWAFIGSFCAYAIDNKVSKEAKIRNRYNQVPHPTQDTTGNKTSHTRDPRG